jgi:hypothetical protein
MHMCTCDSTRYSSTAFYIFEEPGVGQFWENPETAFNRLLHDFDHPARDNVRTIS